MFYGIPAAAADVASGSVFGRHDWTMYALLGAAAIVVVALLIGLLVRHRRRRAEQHMGETFSAAEFTSFCDNMSWYGHSAAGPATPPVPQPRAMPPGAPVSPPMGQPAIHPPMQPPPGRHAAPPR